MKDKQKINELIDQKINQKIGFISKIIIYGLVIVLSHILFYNLVLNIHEIPNWQYYVAGIFVTVTNLFFVILFLGFQLLEYEEK